MKAKDSLIRNEKKDPKMAKHFREKVEQIEATYRGLQRREREIQCGLDKEKRQKDMTKF